MIDRRRLVASIALGCSGLFMNASVASWRKTFVLVHGAWQGGWCWQKLTPYLLNAGHHVFTPTLTGCGDRSHLLNPDIDLETHVRDVVATLDYEDLKDVILVGHS